MVIPITESTGMEELCIADRKTLSDWMFGFWKSDAIRLARKGKMLSDWLV